MSGWRLLRHNCPVEQSSNHFAFDLTRGSAAARPVMSWCDRPMSLRRWCDISGSAIHVGFAAFGPFVLDEHRGELRGAEGAIAVELRAFALLTYMVENKGHLISKDELVVAV